MKWIKKGLIFKTHQNFEWMQSHSQCPLVEQISEDVLRIYFGTRDSFNRTTTTFIEVDAHNPKKVLHINEKPVIGLGKKGKFDDMGAMPSWIANFNNKKYFYYIGWTERKPERYHLSAGLAISKDKGNSFRKTSEKPVMDSSGTDPFSVSPLAVLIEKNLWKAWYVSFTKWEKHGETLEPFYHIKYAESRNGTQWDRKGLVCIDFKSHLEGGITKPCVIKENGQYKMWYCYRHATGYRENKKKSYRIGYAESKDGLKWARKDEKSGITVSKKGWDSEMIAYPFVCKIGDKKYLFYNGNGFGTSGIGYAVLQKQ